MVCSRTHLVPSCEAAALCVFSKWPSKGGRMLLAGAFTAQLRARCTIDDREELMGIEESSNFRRVDETSRHQGW